MKEVIDGRDDGGIGKGSMTVARGSMCHRVGKVEKVRDEGDGGVERDENAHTSLTAPTDQSNPPPTAVSNQGPSQVTLDSFGTPTSSTTSKGSEEMLYKRLGFEHIGTKKLLE